MEAVGLFLGIVFYYTNAWLALVLVLVLYWIGRSVWLVVFFVVGYAIAVGHAYWSADHGILRPQLHKSISISGVVASIPKQSRNKTQFQFNIQRILNQSVSAKAWMTCYHHCPFIQVGETWRLKTMLDRPRVYTSTFHHWLLSNHIQFFGSFSQVGAVRLHAPDWRWSIECLRSSLAKRTTNTLKHDPALGMILGVTLGLGHLISQQHWSLFRRTGSVHLVVISGEHISLVAGACFLTIAWLWGWIGLRLTVLPSHRVAAIASFLIASVYACLAGLGAPIERALIGFGLLLTRYFFSFFLETWQIFSYALLLVLLLEPHVVLTPGFYLSFGAVAILIFSHHRYRHLKRIYQLLVLQWKCLIGLLPLTLFFFNYGSITGFLGNLVLMPLVGWFMVPSALFGVFLNSIFPWIGWFWLARHSTALFLVLSSWLDRLSWLNFEHTSMGMMGLASCLLGMTLYHVMPIQRLIPVYLFLMMVWLVT